MKRSFTILSLSLLSLTAVACGPKPAPKPPHAAAQPPAAKPAPKPPVARTDLRKTAELVQRAEVQKLVDELAAVEKFASEHVSYDGHPSTEYATFARLRQRATDAEMLALLAHESPVVRSYAAQHAIERDLDAPLLVPLLVDQALVPAQWGCIGSTMPVSWVTVNELCNARDKSRAAAHLDTLAKGADDRADQARRCLARH